MKGQRLLFSALLTMNLDASAEMMTVQQIQGLLDKDKQGKIAATAYSQGVFDGLISIEAAKRREGRGGDELCDFFEIAESGGQVQHPASKTKELVEKWKDGGYPMDVPFADLAIGYMDKQYGC